MCVNLKNTKTGKFAFALQWALTAKCDQKCKHCYMYDSPTYKNEIANELSFNNCKNVLDDFAYSVKALNTTGSLAFTGGDPLLREDFFDILAYAKSKGDYITAVMGNPFHLSKDTVKALKNNGVMFYQLSLDGMKDTHDSLRKPGSFESTLRGFELLNDAGISPVCMFTISKLNMNELPDVIKLVSEYKVGGFAFDRLVPVGCGEGLKDCLITPLEYKELLLKIKDEYKRLSASGSKTIYTYKDSLWGLLLNEEEEKEILKLYPPNTEVVRGCSIGRAGLCLLSDGNVMACRRLPIIIGKVPDEKLLDIFNDSSVLNNLREMQNIDICGSCDKFPLCRGGCRAVAYGYSNGDYFSPDPQCWYPQNI